MRAYTTTTRDRGVTVIPADLRETAKIAPNTELTWVEVESQLWLVGPRSRHPEEVAPIVVSAILAEQSPFPKLMRRLLADEILQPASRGRRRSYHPIQAPALTEEQMIAFGTPPTPPQRRRGHR